MKIPIYLILIVIFLSALAIAIINYQKPQGFVEQNLLQVQGNTIILGRDCKAIISDTSPERAYAIQLGIEGRIEERPTVYDLWVQTLKSFNITMDSIEFSRFDGSYYYADIIFHNNEKILKLSAKPSDAIALALKADAPIYVNQTLLDEIGQQVC